MRAAIRESKWLSWTLTDNASEIAEAADEDLIFVSDMNDLVAELKRRYPDKCPVVASYDKKTVTVYNAKHAYVFRRENPTSQELVKALALAKAYGSCLVDGNIDRSKVPPDYVLGNVGRYHRLSYKPGREKKSIARAITCSDLRDARGSVHKLIEKKNRCVGACLVARESGFGPNFETLVDIVVGTIAVSDLVCGKAETNKALSNLRSRFLENEKKSRERLKDFGVLVKRLDSLKVAKKSAS